MKKTLLSTALLIAAFAFNSTYAQLAKKKDVTIEEITKEVNTLAQKGDDASMNQLLVEAKALSESKNENFVSFSTRIYRFLDKTDEAEKIEKTIKKRFPKGIAARNEAYEKIFKDKTLSATEAEKLYNDFLKKFPSTLFTEKDRGVYSAADAQLASLYFKEKNLTKANEYVSKLRNSPSFISSSYTLLTSLVNNEDYTNALPIIQEVYTKAQEDSKEARYATMLGTMYGKALYETGNTTEAISTIESLLSKNAQLKADPNIRTLLAKAYAKQGKELDAFLILENLAVKDGKTKEIEELIQPLYNKLNNGKGDYAKFIAKIDAEAKEAKIAKYKAEMIKEEAPNFSLVNMEGKTVSLADMKGKVVILDFWATWCGPCVGSFPGMQAGVDKYKDDKEVEFLFINCWQSEKNYKEVVENFLKEKNYRFHVLFDEMQDKSKSITTAYGVKGIPTKVFIDKEGYIRFNSAGGIYDVQKLVDELETKIELLRKG